MCIDLISFGMYIKSIRKSKKIDLYQLKEKYDFSYSYWLKIEDGKLESIPSLEDLVKISKILEINPIILFKMASYLTNDDLDNYYNK